MPTYYIKEVYVGRITFEATIEAENEDEARENFMDVAEETETDLDFVAESEIKELTD